MNITKARKYQRIIKQIEVLMAQCKNTITRMSTINAILYHKMTAFSWVGFYLLVDEQLIAGPYQGPLACQVLEKNKGVCWAGINNRKTIVVPDVHDFPGHIACDKRTQSEIVVPLKNENDIIIGVLDIDSRIKNNFDDVDAKELEKIISLIYK
jgi:GAF domain-containing protein